MVLTTKGKLTIALIVIVIIALVAFIIYSLVNGGSDETTTAAMVNTMEYSVEIMVRSMIV